MNTNQTSVLRRLAHGVSTLACGLLLASCGGGGGNPGAVPGAGTPGGSVGGPTVAISFINSNAVASNIVSNTVSLTAKALVLDKDSKPVVNALVTFTTTGADITAMTPSAGTSLTDNNGIATVLLRPSSASVSGAATLTASVSVAGSAVTGTANYVVSASSPAGLTLSLLNVSGQLTSTMASNGTLTAKAVVTDKDGKAVSNALVTFSTDATLAVLTPATVVTDANGAATTLVRPSSISASGAGKVTASVAIAGVPLSSEANFTVLVAAVPTSLVVTFANPNGQAASSVSSASPLTVKAVVTDRNGVAVPNTIVTFATDSTLGTIAPSTGTSLTDNSGVALATLRPASLLVNGAGKVTASVVSGGSILSGEGNYTVVISPVSSANVAVSFLNTAGQPSNSVTSATPLTARAVVTDKDGLPIANALVTFATDATLAVFSPSTGTTLTNASGVATLTMRPASLAASGAGSVTAATVVSGTTLTGNANYMVGATSLTLGTLNLSPSSVAAYGSTVVSIDVLADGVKYTDQQMNVNFTSACVTAGKATFAATVATNSGTASAVYRDQGCANNDLISASVSGVTQSKSATLTIAAPAPTSIQFESASPIDNSIVIKGQGGISRTETATLKFKVFDIFSNPLPGKSVTFTKIPANADVTINKAVDSTDQNGEVIMTVNSGTTATTFRVQATVTGTAISTQSDSIVVTTGQAVQRAMSISEVKANIEGWTYDSGPVTPATQVNILLADKFGNPVADGTPITFQTNMGAIGTSSKGACNTVNGGCSVDFRTQEPRLPTANTPITPCNTASAAGATGITNDATRTGLATICASTPDGSAILFRKIAIFFSGSFASKVFYNGALTPLDGTTVDIGNIAAGSFKTFTLQINDLNLNPMPVGTTVAITGTFNASAIGVSPATVQNVFAHNSTADDPTGNNVSGNQGTTHVVSIGSPLGTSCTGTVHGSFSVSITTPLGNSTSYPFSATMTCP
jgi:hypothetical protein